MASEKGASPSTTAPAAPPAPISSALERFFEGLSRLRGRRIFHPKGVGFAAELRPFSQNGSRLPLFDDGPRTAIVRISRAAGVPEPLPDALGLAVRVPDAYGIGLHQDLLLISSGGRPGARHLILPSRGLLDRPYSCLLPYRANGDAAMIGALPDRASGPGPNMRELEQENFANVKFRLAIAPPTGGWVPAATLLIGDRLPHAIVEDLCFDPTNTGRGLELAGFLNRLRHPAYHGSQRGRGMTPRGATSPARQQEVEPV